MNFIIYLLNNKVRVINHSLNQTLKKEGEEVFEFDTSFWEWFKDKIDYNNEELSFVIITDTDFEIDNSIKISKTSGFETFPQISTYKNSKILTFPKLEKKLKKVIKSSNEYTVLDIFIEESQKYKNKK
jgi:hypothetical protein